MAGWELVRVETDKKMVQGPTNLSFSTELGHGYYVEVTKIMFL